MKKVELLRENSKLKYYLTELLINCIESEKDKTLDKTLKLYFKELKRSIEEVLEIKEVKEINFDKLGDDKSGK